MARFDLAYEKINGKSHRESGYLTIGDLDSLNWIGKSVDFTYASATTHEAKPLLIKAMTIPKASKDIRVKMCGIAPFTSLRVTKVEIRLSEFDDFMTASDFNSNDLLSCFDTGLFLTNCRLRETILDDPGSLEMEYTLDVNFGCEGHEVDFALVTDSNSIVLKPNIKTVNIRGRGLKLVDKSPAKTRAATFNPGCNFSVGRVEKVVSPEQVEALREKKAVLEADLANAKQTSRAFVDITLLARIIEALRDSLELTSRFRRGTGAVANDVTLQDLL